MKNNKKQIIVIVLFIIIIIIILIIVLAKSVLFYDTNEGRAYKSRQVLCIDFAQSYLRTIPKTEPDYNNEKWVMAVNVETDLYNLCLLNLNKESLKNFNLSGLQRYKK